MSSNEWLAALVLALIIVALFLFTAEWGFDLNLEAIR